MIRILRVYIDTLEPKQALPLAPDAMPRAIYVREGDLTVRCGAQAATLAPNSAWHGIEPCALEAGARGASVVRWELAPDESRDASALLAHAVDLTDPGGYLMRCDRVDFPPGGIAYTHTHRGPGIRVLLAGALRVESAGEVHLVRPGGAWFESGPDPVLAVAAEREPTSFVRVMILPREIRGRPSIRYVKAEDQDKPKTQRYQVFCDEPIEP